MIIDSKIDSDFGILYKYVHKSEPIRGMNSKNFIDFSNSCSYDMNRIDDEICTLLATTNLDNYPTIHSVIPPNLKNLTGEFENTVLYEYEEDHQTIREMTRMQRRKYLFFKRRSILPWFFMLVLKPTKQFIDRARNVYPWNSISNAIPYTKSIIESLPFAEIGRVVIYGSWPESTVPCHRDSPGTFSYGHHINFNPGSYRPIYVYDSLNNVKYYLPQDYKFYAYNTSDYHGVDALPHFSYTVRVDGMYNDEALRIINQ